MEKLFGGIILIWHSSSADEVIAELKTDKNGGLTSDQVAERTISYGKNEFSNPLRKGLTHYIISEFASFFNIALTVVAVIFAVLTLALEQSGWIGSVMLIVAVLINSVISGISRADTDKELDALRNTVPSFVIVIRDGKEVSILSDELVPGDIMVLKSGDYIRADGRLIDTYAMTCDEFRITGDTAPSEKLHEPLYEDITPLVNRHNMVYSGSLVLNGKGLAVVTETGTSTEIGMQEDMALQIADSETVLGEKLAKTEKIASNAVLIAAMFIFFLGIVVDFASTNVSFAVTVTNYLLLALSVYVACSTVKIRSFQKTATVAAVRRLQKKHITVKDAVSIEGLKDISIICTDKTGALTTESLNVRKLYTGNKVIDLFEQRCDDQSAALLRLALICSNFAHNEHTERHSNNMESAIEDACVTQVGMSKTDIDGLYPKIAELPFDSERMMMTTVTAISGNPIAIVKGAPEVIVTRCRGGESEKINNIATDFAKGGLKVIAVAIKPLSEIPANPNSEELENDLNFVGIIGFEDEIDPEAVSLCQECIAGGIKIVMITGDHLDTAAAVGMKVGIIENESAAISGDKLSELDDVHLASVIDNYAVFARISPDDKQRIVSAFKAAGEKVLVTGDSLNDTRALLEADLGCALGRTASDIVRNSADIVVNDNKFSSVISAFKESVRIFTGVKKALGYLLTAILTTLIVTVFGLLIFGNSPLSMSGIVFLDLITLSLPLGALFFDRSDTSGSVALKSKNIFSKDFLCGFAVPSVFISLMSLVGYGVTLSAGTASAYATAFAVIAVCEVIHAFCINFRCSVFSSRTPVSPVVLINCGCALLIFAILLITPCGSLLSLGGLSGIGWLMILISALGTVIIDEAFKLISSRIFKA